MPSGITCTGQRHLQNRVQRKWPNGHPSSTTFRMFTPTRTLNFQSVLILIESPKTQASGFSQVCNSCSSFPNSETGNSLVMFCFFHSGSVALYKVEKLLVNKRVLGDVRKLSSDHQTSSLEAFHSVVIRFAPKSVVYPYVGMMCR